MDNNGQPTNMPSISYVDDYQPPTSSAPVVAPPADFSNPTTIPAVSNPSLSSDDGMKTSAPTSMFPPVTAQVPHDMPAINLPDITKAAPGSTPSEPAPAMGFSMPPVSTKVDMPSEPASTMSMPKMSEDTDSDVIMPKAPASSASSMSDAVPAASAETSEKLADQNIFTMLGIDAIAEKEKDSFLDELQQVIWEDFVDHDVELLTTQEEYTQFKALGVKAYPSEEEKQGAMIEFLEKLIPDLENIMMEKAMELKEEMFRERVKELKQMYQGQAEKMSKLEAIDASVSKDMWRTATKQLNELMA